MPPEWAVHERTWMAWPPRSMSTFYPDTIEAAYDAWAAVANAIAAFEPVAMICPQEEQSIAAHYLFDQIDLMEGTVNAPWIRDTGPTFVLQTEAVGGHRLGAVDWTFNGWGGRLLPDETGDMGTAARVANLADATHLRSYLINEGGGIHVDGDGTVLLTETVQLNANRNPNWTRTEIEREVHFHLGTEKAIWLPRGLVADRDEDGTDGHVDTLACFLKPGVVAVHGQKDPTHPDFDTCQEIAELLRREHDAKGHPLQVIVLDAPEEKYHNSAPLSCSYVNFSFVNGGVVLCAFGDPQDDIIADQLSQALPDRRIAQVPALNIFKGGGGIHCITQQQPSLHQVSK